MESHVAAVRNIYLADTDSGTCVHYLDLMRAVYRHIQFRAVDDYVVAYVAQFLDYRRVAFAIEIAGI